jgi:hypothetical protein
MQIDIRFRGLEPSPVLKDFALRQVQFHLSRFAEEVSGVLMRVQRLKALTPRARWPGSARAFTPFHA